jgi:hypothetical protein
MIAHSVVYPAAHFFLAFYSTGEEIGGFTLKRTDIQSIKPVA